MTPSRVAQIAQIKDTVESLESSFVNLKLKTESKFGEMVTQQTFQDKSFSLAQSQKTDIRSLQSRCNNLETAKEILTNRVKTLEDQNQQQFRQIGKSEGAVNTTLTSLVKDIFHNTNQHQSMEPTGLQAAL